VDRGGSAAMGDIEVDLKKFQAELKEWSVHNFGPLPPEGELPEHPLTGLMEELGELAHAHLKQQQGIRGTASEHEAAAKDAIGDLIIFLCDYSTRRGWDLDELSNKGVDINVTPCKGLPDDALHRLGAVLGELCDYHVLWKHLPNDRLTFAKDSRHSVSMFLANLQIYAIHRGWNAYSLGMTTWNTIVKKRDWKANPATGTSPLSVPAPSLDLDYGDGKRCGTPTSATGPDVHAPVEGGFKYSEKGAGTFHLPHGRDASSVPGMELKVCSRCSNKFLCGMKSGKTCWCDGLPHAIPLPGGYVECICRTCLDKELAEKGKG